MDHSFNITIELFLEIIGVFLSLFIILQLLFNRQENRRSHTILILLIFQFFVQEFMSVSIGFKLTTLNLYTMFLLMPSVIFISPFTYFYIRSLTLPKNLFSNKRYLHILLPLIYTVIMFLINYIYILFPREEFSKTLLTVFFILAQVGVYLILPVQTIMYGYLVIRLYNKHLKRIPDYFSYEEGIKLRWIRGFVLAYLIFMVEYLIINISYNINGPWVDIIYQLFILGFLVFIGVFGVKQGEIYSSSLIQENDKELMNMLFIKQEDNRIDEDEIVDTPENLTTVSSRSSDTFFGNEEKKSVLKDALLQLMELEKPYLKSSLTIEDLCSPLKTNKTYLSHIINEEFQKNFYTFINDYRIEEAKKKLVNSEESFYSIEGIGNLCGFKSRSSFYTAFKKTTGKTPAEYKQEYMIQKS